MSRIRIHRGARIMAVLAAVVLLAYVLIGNGAFAGATFATGSGQAGLELTIDSESTYNGVAQPNLSWSLKNLVPGVDRFFNFGDIKPGDTGENTVSIHIDKNPAYVCLDFVNLTDLENGVNEPESLVDVDPLSGELAEGLEFFAWHDDGDNIFELGEKPMFGTTTQSATVVLASTTYPLADAGTGAPFAKGSTHYFGITWCAGDMEVNVNTASITCDATTLGNEAQTDSMSVDVILRAVQANERPNFLCRVPDDSCDEEEKGNNGHGNDDDHNDDSNPGNSNDENDDTDDDGLPPGFAKKSNDTAAVVGSTVWEQKEKNGPVETVITNTKNAWKRLRS